MTAPAEATRRVTVREMSQELTGPQTPLAGAGGRLMKHMRLPYWKARQIRKDPTVALVRACSVAIVQASSWQFNAEGDTPDELVDEVREQLDPLRSELVRTALEANVDYGWAGYEKIFEVEDQRVRVRDLKNLLVDFTQILIDPDTGRFLGFEQHAVNGQAVILPAGKSLRVSFRVEGTDWYGQALLENTERHYDQAVDAEDGACRYDKRLAGAHFVVEYPVGTTPLNDEPCDNAEIADAILHTLESSGRMSIPVEIASFASDLDAAKNAWKVYFLEDKGGRQPTFIERLKYLDTLKVRSLLVPERSILEGQYGTLAEAESHADFAFLVLSMVDQQIAKAVNEQVINQLLAANEGPDAKGIVWVEPSPLIDTAKKYLQQVYATILSNPNAYLDELPTIDTDSLKDALDVPKSDRVTAAGQEGEPGGGRDMLRQVMDRLGVGDNGNGGD